jgi:hypothetical protein
VKAIAALSICLNKERGMFSSSPFFAEPKEN